MSKTAAEDYKILLSQISKIVDNPQQLRNEKLQDVCQLLSDEIAVFDWVGFYLIAPDAERELVLGPFVGEATEHTRIPFGTGICGQAAETNETFVVQDVSKADNYLACSVEVESEIVVPVMKEDEFVAEIDIDSHKKNSLTKAHRKLLEEVSEIVAQLF